jgi:hypothetical protein
MAPFDPSSSTSTIIWTVEKAPMRWYLEGVKLPACAVMLAMVLLCALPAAAQETPEKDRETVASAYGLGDQVLSISLGPMIPLFYLPNAGAEGTNLTVGGTGSLAWSAYLTGAIRVGAEIGGVFAFSRPNTNTLLMLPILARAQYVMTFYPFEVPISLGVGMNIVKYGELRNIDLLIKPGASVLWIYDSKWSFGLNLAWWLDMQFYPSDPTQNRIGNFLEISLSALYHYQ